MGKPILIIEDDEGLADLIRRIVEKCGFDAENAYCASEAFQWLESHSPHLILLDYSLPGSNAKEFILELLAKNQPLPYIVVSTGQCDNDLVEEVLALGAQEFIAKDSHFLELLPQLIAQAKPEN